RTCILIAPPCVTKCCRFFVLCVAAADGPLLGLSAGTAGWLPGRGPGAPGLRRWAGWCRGWGVVRWVDRCLPGVPVGRFRSPWPLGVPGRGEGGRGRG